MIYYKVILILLTFVMGIQSKMHSDEDVEYSRWNPLLIRRSFRPYLSEKEIFRDTLHYFNEFADYYNYQFKNSTSRKTAFAHFKNSLKKSLELNERNSTAVFKVNEFSIYSLKKFLSLYTGFNDSKLNMTEARKFNIEVDHLPKELDYRGTWVESGAYDQGECRSSYVFSAIQNIEAQLMKSFNYKSSLSMQYGFECELAGNCVDGGLPHLVMEALMKTGALEADKYLAYNNSFHDKSCKTNHTAVAKVTGYYIFTVEKEEHLENALALYGPLTIAINVGNELKNYYSGILNPTDCNNKPNHAVLLVGYGTNNDNGIKYWIIRNSWGSGWGENGFFRLVRGNWACGIGSYTATATVEISTGWNGTVTPIVLPDLAKPRSVRMDVKPEYSEYYSSLDKDQTTEVELPPNNINSNESVIRNVDYLKTKFQKFKKQNITIDLNKLLIVDSLENTTVKTKATILKPLKQKDKILKVTKPTEHTSTQSKTKNDTEKPKPTQATGKPITNESGLSDHGLNQTNTENPITKTSITKDLKVRQTEKGKPTTKESKPKDDKPTKIGKPSTKLVKVNNQTITKSKVKKSVTRKSNDKKSIQTKGQTHNTESSTPNERKTNVTNLEKPTTQELKTKISVRTTREYDYVVVSRKPRNSTLKSTSATVRYEKKESEQTVPKNLTLVENTTESTTVKLEKPNLRASSDLKESVTTQPKPTSGTQKPKPVKLKPNDTKLNESVKLTPKMKSDTNLSTEVSSRKKKRKRIRSRRKYKNNDIRAMFGPLLDLSIVSQVLKSPVKEFTIAMNQTEGSDGRSTISAKERTNITEKRNTTMAGSTVTKKMGRLAYFSFI